MNLKIVEIRGAGTKEERIFLKAEGNCNLGNYLVYDETYDEEGNPSNLFPHMHRFSLLEVKKGEFVSFRTQGNPNNNHKGTLDDNETVCYYRYWGLDRTIFNQDKDAAHLIYVGGEQTKTK